jgi:hypothetical protein
MRPRTPLLVQVVWIDACNVYGSWKLDEVGAAVGLKANRHTAGRFVHVDWPADGAVTPLTKLIIAHDYDPDDDECGDCVAIPLGWVRSIRTARGRTIYSA